MTEGRGLIDELGRGMTDGLGREAAGGMTDGLGRGTMGGETVEGRETGRGVAEG